MKSNVAIPLAVAGMSVGLTTAILAANGVFKGHIGWAYLSGGLAIFMIAVAVVGWIRYQPPSVKLKVIPCDDLRENDSMPRDIFGRVRIELSEPTKVKVKGYSATFSRNGVIENVKVLNDADKWVLHDSESPIPRHDPVHPLPVKLRSGHPVEAWFHFRTTRNRYEIQSGRLDFFVHTALGDGNAEIPLTSEHWNRTHRNLIMPRF